MLSDKQIREFQDIFAKKFGKKINWQEASDAAHRLVNFVDLLMQLDNKEKQRQLKLGDNPKGFHLTDGTYTCCICGDQITGERTWYDKNGIKCLLCQKALDRKIIPAEACRDRDSWYKIWELEYYFKMKPPTARKLIRNGKLKARIVPGESKRPHCYVLMIKDNQGMLPKKPDSKLVKTSEGYTTIEYEPVSLPDGLTSE